MVMLALSLGIFIVILYISSSLVSSSSAQIGLDSAYRAVEHIRESADFIYIHGHPSRTQINVYIPPNIENISVINNNTVSARVGVGHYYTDIYSVSRGSLTGNLSTIQREGYYLVNLVSVSDEVVSISVI